MNTEERINSTAFSLVLSIVMFVVHVNLITGLNAPFISYAESIVLFVLGGLSSCVFVRYSKVTFSVWFPLQCGLLWFALWPLLAVEIPIKVNIVEWDDLQDVRGSSPEWYGSGLFLWMVEISLILTSLGCYIKHLKARNNH